MDIPDDITNQIILFISYKDITSLKCCNLKLSTFNYNWRNYFYHYLNSECHNLYKEMRIDKKFIKNEMDVLIKCDNIYGHQQYVKYYLKIANVELNEIFPCIFYFYLDIGIITVNVLTVSEWIDTLEFKKVHKDVRQYIESKWVAGDKLLINGEVEDGPFIDVARNVVLDKIIRKIEVVTKYNEIFEYL